MHAQPEMSDNENGLGDFYIPDQAITRYLGPQSKAQCAYLVVRRLSEVMLALHTNGDAEQALELIVMMFGHMIAEAPHRMIGR